MSDLRLDLYGGNRDAFMSKEAEVLNAGPAGTGKTAAWLAKVLTVCNNYPGARVLVVRKTRESLTESVLVTWERDVLGPRHPVLLKNPNLRKVRQSYQFANGSTVVVGGMDKPDKVLSSEWDMVYVPEATDLDLVDWETLGGRLRAGRVSFQQLAADCNPTSPHHWLYKRCQAGLTRLYSTTHKDNPRFWDRVAGAWTPDGEQYLARLERMTGARRDRFLKGLWVAAEGAVYAYDPATHLKAHSWAPEQSWRRVWGIDWGKTSPTVLGLWAIDPECRMHGYREVYQTRLRPDQLGKWAKDQIESGAEPRPLAIVCDHDEERKQDFERASGLTLSLADKRDRDKGIEAMQAMFDVQPDGLPRVFFRADSRETLRGPEADRFLVDSGRPTCGIEELVGYVWDEDFREDEPIADNDHFLDQMRYVQRWVQSNLAGVAPRPATPAAKPRLPTYLGAPAPRRR